jgi:hypothetical protein
MGKETCNVLGAKCEDILKILRYVIDLLVILISTFSKWKCVKKQQNKRGENPGDANISRFSFVFPFLASFVLCLCVSFLIYSLWIYSCTSFFLLILNFHLTALSVANIIVRNVGYEGIDKYNTDGGKVKHSEVNPVQVPLCPPQIPHILAHCWVLASHTTWHIVQPPPFSIFNSVFIFPFPCLYNHSFLLWFISHSIPSFRSHFHLSPLLSERSLWTQRVRTLN